MTGDITIKYLIHRWYQVFKCFNCQAKWISIQSFSLEHMQLQYKIKCRK